MWFFNSTKTDDIKLVIKELEDDQIYPSEINFLSYRLNILYDLYKDERIKKIIKMFENKL